MNSSKEEGYIMSNKIISKRNGIPNQIGILFVICLLIALFSQTTMAATYYVRKDGHDTSCNGTADAALASAPNCAWKTIQKAATTVSGTNTVIVGNGTYAERVTVAKSGTNASNLLTFQAQNKWLAVLDGTTAGFALSGNYIKIDGFNVQGYTSASYYGSVQSSGNYNTITNLHCNSLYKRSIDVSGTYNTISYNYIYQPQWGMWIAGTGHLVNNNEVDQLYIHEAGNDVDYSRFFGTGITFSRNNFHGADMEAFHLLDISIRPHVDCFQTYTEGGGGNSYNILIERNFCSGSDEGVMASSTTAGSNGLIIRNNVFVNASAYGVAIWNWKNVKVYNNTFDLSAGLNGVGGYYGVGCVTSPATCDVRNNIVYGAHAGTAAPIYISGGAAWITPPVNNLIYRSGKTYSAVTYPSANKVNQDPLFMGANNYRLQPGSPAEGVGAIISSVTDDYTGALRPQGSTWNIGAYESKLASPRLTIILPTKKGPN